MTTAHALLSPSAAHRWMKCPASAALGSLYENTSSKYADEGTAAHELAANALEWGTDATHYLDTEITVNGNIFTVDEEMAEHVQEYVDYVRAQGGELSIEESLDVSAITCEEGAKGTSDAVIVNGDELILVDLKYGQGVRVNAEGNQQLQLYALGALELYELTNEFKTVRMVIVQPRLNHIDEWTVSVSQLQLFREEVKKAASKCQTAVTYFNQYQELHSKYFSPSESACQFCRAKANCPALAEFAMSTIADDFVDLTKPIEPQIVDALLRVVDNATLGNLRSAVPLIEEWCAAIRAKTESELLSENPVPGFKLVEGRKGNRTWRDKDEAESLLKQMRIKPEHMYKSTLITPTAAEKLAKDGNIGPRQWPKVQELITRAPGKPSVAPADDKRPAWVKPDVSADFENLDEGEDLV